MSSRDVSYLGDADVGVVAAGTGVEASTLDLTLE